MTLGNIEITDNLPESLGRFFSAHDFSQVAVLVDENTEKQCYNVVSDHLPKHTLIRIKSGEAEKNLATCEQIWGHLTDAEFDRKGLLVNLGGGVIGDMGGFCAATYKRGIAFLNLPTTLLAQVDASVGGKLGIDFNGLKNHIGLFKEPQRVIIWPGFLRSLPERELRSGYAEVLKHSLIADAAYWQKLIARPFEAQPWKEHIEHSVKIKADVVAADPTEKGLRKILNFGHTIGHAIETALLNTDNHLLHGEAIAIGMISEAYLSVKKCSLSPQAYHDIRMAIGNIYQLAPVGEDTIEKALKLIVQDKKNEKATIKGSLLNALGKAVYDVNISLEEVRESLEEFNSIANPAASR